MNKPSFPSKYNCLVVLGPTAVGKTALAVKLAEHFHSEILSADSRQVYKGLNIGSGKDLNEYTVPYHLIDITDLSHEYSVYDYQSDFHTAFNEITQRSILPIIAGGTGMYLDAIIRGYNLIKVPTNEGLRENLLGKSMEELAKILINLKAKVGKTVHNDTDLTEHHRLLRAIEIETFEQSGQAIEKQNIKNKAEMKPLIIGTTFPRDILRANIKKRLLSRIEEGMIEEVASLHKDYSWERLERLGLEYRFISELLQGKIGNKQEMIDKLYIAIGQFAKRQETWYRGMVKKGVTIHWLPHDGTIRDCEKNTRYEYSLNIIQKA